MLKWKLKNDFKQARDVLEQAEWQPSKKSQLTLPQGCWRGEMLKMMLMMRWEPLCCHRSLRQQHWVLKDLLSEFSIYSSPLISQWGVVQEGQEMNGQSDTYMWSQPDFQLLAGPAFNEQGLKLIFDWGRQITPLFIFTGDTTTVFIVFWQNHYADGIRSEEGMFLFIV